jgi:DNA (cytosine-5)-methyltransferase 1
MKAGNGSGNTPKIIEDMAKIYRIRKLTPRECFRLMGVSDKDIDKIQAYPLIPQSDGIVIRPAGMTDAEVKKLKISESQQYKMAGNSIVVQVLEGIFTQMFREDHDALF